MNKVLKTFGKWMLGLVVLFFIALTIPLMYVMLLVLAVLLPPLLIGLLIFEDREEYKVRNVRDALYKGALILIVLPMGLFAFAAPLRSLTMLAFSFFPSVLNAFNDMHEFLHEFFIPRFGELFPYWLDFYWGIYAVLVFFVVAVIDSAQRSKLVRQIDIIPTSRVRSAAIGLTELAGKAVPLDPKDDVIIRKWMQQSDAGYSFQSYANPFYLDDGTGRILIDPADSNIDQIDSIFNVKLHHVFLKKYEKAGQFNEGRLVAGDDVYVLGNVQINREADPDGNEDGIVVKPIRSSLLHPKFYDIFFLANTSEEELLHRLRRSVKRGWFDVLILMFITGWLAVYAWCNITQLKQMDLDAAPALFRLVTTPTVLERRFGNADMGENTTLDWLEQLQLGDERYEDILYLLKEQRLQRLAIPVLLEHAGSLDHPVFAPANHWLAKLDAVPAGHWGNVYYYDRQVHENHTLVSRVLLRLDGPRLLASYRAHFHDPDSSDFVIKGRYVVFEFTHKESGIVKAFSVWSEGGWNKVDGYEIFEHFLPGEYSLVVYARREYRGGRFDRGNSAHKPRNVRL